MANEVSAKVIPLRPKFSAAASAPVLLGTEGFVWNSVDTMQGFAGGEMNMNAAVPYTLVSRYELPDAQAEASRLAQELAELRSEIRRLADAVSTLADGLGHRAVATREVSAQQAREEIVAFMTEHAPAYPSDIADELNLDYEVVVEILAALRQEGAAAPQDLG